MDKFTKIFQSYCEKFKSLCDIQIKEVIEGGALVFLRKLFKLCLLPFALGIVVLVRALRPFILIRFGMLISGRIGSFSYHPEMYLCHRDVGMWQGQRIFDIFYCENIICNYQLKKMWGRVLFIPPFSRFVYLVDFINHLFPHCKEHEIPWFHWDHRVFSKCNSSHLFFTTQEARKGSVGIKSLGIPENTPFVCFHARNPLYLNSIMPGNNFYYHNYRDCSINNFVPAMESLTKKGYFAIRMGAIVKDPLVTTNPMIIDYATKRRNDFMDIYLSTNCNFFVGSCSGIDEIPKIFRRAPVLAVNIIPFKELCYAGPIKLFIPKKLWLKRERRILRFREIFNSQIAGFNMTEQYDNYGIEVLENTPEEISAAVLEIEAMVNGTWQKDEEAEKLQQRFWSLSDSIFNGLILSRIGTEFLRRNQELLA